MEVRNILSEKQKYLKIIDNYKFCFHKCLANNIQRWKCTVKTCKAYLKIKENDHVLFNVSDTAHNHDALSEEIINRHIVSNSLKRKGTQELYERPAKLMNRYLKESIDVSVKNTLTITDIRYIKNNLYRARSEQLPKLPTSILTVHSALNAKNEPFLFLNDSINDKQTITYSEAFKAIDLECSKVCPEFKIDVIYVDFEVSFEANSENLARNTYKGCRFYLGQSCPEEVGDFFSFELSEIQPVDSKVVDFADYLVNNYILEESLFPPSIWTEKSSSLQRTTNACESFHKKLNSFF
ncbi:hypothetical protein AGLY_015721 [Aphis glycines]|uniref:Uncharacterized protein n=1 Tax=Aphis glycines TaxID=307491 RepID=A0A6G0SZN3_APHGL|nr:hypothetical protein AGLY_015721 [Aphis glycines]